MALGTVLAQYIGLLTAVLMLRAKYREYLTPIVWRDVMQRAALMRQIEDEMITAAKDLEFERAAKLRDRLLELRGEAPMKDDHQNRRHRRRERTRKSEH